jgi:hypothetical protein
MKPNLVDLNHHQFFAMYIAMVVRDAMEDFHVKYLTDEQMAELNPIIRNAIYTALRANADADDNEYSLMYVNSNLETIPRYWEPPELDEGYTYMASGKWQEDMDRLLCRGAEKD